MADPPAHDDVADGMDVHTFFGLTYANYLVLHRTLLQSMPTEWQLRFVRCLRELQEAFWHVDQADDYWVRAKDRNGRFITEPVPHYNRGRTYVAPHIGPGPGWAAECEEFGCHDEQESDNP